MSRLLLIFFFVVSGVLSRLTPHPPNFTPLGAISIFSGSYFKNINAGLLPLVILGLSDLLISGSYGPVMFYVYGSFWLTFLLSYWFRRRLKDFRILILLTVSTSTLFYVVTNFGVWLHAGLYPRTFPGLILCYVAALPFFRNTILGDLFYVTTFYLSYQVFRKISLWGRSRVTRFYEHLHPNRRPW